MDGSYVNNVILNQFYNHVWRNEGRVKSRGNKNLSNVPDLGWMLLLVE